MVTFDFPPLFPSFQAKAEASESPFSARGRALLVLEQGRTALSPLLPPVPTEIRRQTRPQPNNLTLRPFLGGFRSPIKYTHPPSGVRHPSVPDDRRSPRMPGGFYPLTVPSIQVEARGGKVVWTSRRLRP